jgi:hypothetical protein
MKRLLRWIKVQAVLWWVLAQAHIFSREYERLMALRAEEKRLNKSERPEFSAQGSAHSIVEGLRVFIDADLCERKTDKIAAKIKRALRVLTPDQKIVRLSKRIIARLQGVVSALENISGGKYDRAVQN